MARSTSTRVPMPPPTAAPRPTGIPRRSSMLSLRLPICHRIADLPHLRRPTWAGRGRFSRHTVVPQSVRAGSSSPQAAKCFQGLAREIQTLWFLSGGRFVLGIGPGWDQHEFETLGMKLSERGRRTDEIIAALRRLLTERDVTFEGRYYRFQHVTIEPLLPRVPELWVGGGSKIQTSLSPDKPYVVPAVLNRIAGADGWLARAAGSQQMVKDDVRAIREHCAKIGRDPNSLRYGHLNFLHLVDTSDREKALSLQRPIFERVMGTHRTFENLQQSYFLGTTREIVERIRDLEAAGVQDMVLATCDYDLEQLERFATDIVRRFEREP